MSYQKANHLLPAELVELIQQYVDGESIYIPKKEENKKPWGSGTTTRRELDIRNATIYADYLKGIHTSTLAEKYYLSLKSIQRIILKEKSRPMR
ncbi:CD3324 family protein [Sporosarcina sp. NPDC096371]|uniref:CD3324 family protein n=1 Tax=Sporosarcina sp. NPDC096371 TaxID=3364530 RepID=UPI003818FD02